MAFLEDPRLRQRWNQITHDAETVTENAAAGIWSFKHNYINPCLDSLIESVEQCTAVCLGDPEERIRRQRERARERAEYSFNFYDDWGEEEEGGGLLGNWGGEDWDRLLAGSGSAKRNETIDQPRRKRGMSYGTRGIRRKASMEDPTIIPSTQPIGFLSKLPWRMGGTLRYKPSAADLQDHPGARRQSDAEAQPLLSSENASHYGELQVARTRKRSGTTGSGDTSDSYRSRGDLFPSDGEGDEDAIPLDDEVTYDMIRKDDRSSGKSGRTRSSKGKRPADEVSRTVSRTTLGSVTSTESHSIGGRGSSTSLPPMPDAETLPSMEDLELEEERLQREEDEELLRKKEAALQLALEKGLHVRLEQKPQEVAADEDYESHKPYDVHIDDGYDDEADGPDESGVSGPGLQMRRNDTKSSDNGAFVPARLPQFG